MTGLVNPSESAYKTGKFTGKCFLPVLLGLEEVKAMLTDMQIRKLKPPPPDQKHPNKEPFGNGLRLFVYSNKKLKWYIDYVFEGNSYSLPVGEYFNPPNGVKLPPNHVSLADALKKRDEAKALRKQGINPKVYYAEQEAAKNAKPVELPTLESVIDTFMLKESIQHKGHKWNFNRLKKFIREYPDICGLPIGKVTPLQLIEWRDDRLELVASSSVSREHNLLSSVFTYAIKEMQLIQENPFSKVKKPKTGIPRHRRVSQEEVEIICAACGYEIGSTPMNKTQQVAWCFMFAIMTAMRASEITSITWENIKFDKRYIHLPDTKNGSVRNVPLLNAAIAHVELMRDVDETRLVTIDAPSLSTLFRTIRNRTALKDADLRFHDSRHEACTQLAKVLAIQDLAKVSGHKDLKILLNVYYNITAEELADKMNS
jgi:integrase